MNALVIEISFFEAFFKVHHTRGFRLSYPIPLPTSVAGIFGALLGVERGKMKEFDFLFGAKIKKYQGSTNENATFLQYKSKGIERGVASLNLVNSPTYLIAMGGKEDNVEEVLTKLRTSVEFLPYGGQNDFFVSDWKIVGIDEIEESNEIANYAPQDWIEPKFEGSLELQILPVRHTLSENPNFYFLTKGKLKLKNKALCTKSEKIGLYALDGFQVL